MGQNPDDRDALSDLPLPTLEFTKVDEYTTFRAEFAVDANDLVFHFFLPPELEEALTRGPAIKQRVEKYWEDGFARTLDVVARDYFSAEYPQLRAAHVKEYGINSWWLRADGMANVPDPDGRCRRFIEKLDQALDALKVSHLGV